ncbi:MAG: general secretion pathway protein GspK [Desulfamplus sp.]|nr:general secretion pathway protein GspK [Desulfamplus sp.]
MISNKDIKINGSCGSVLVLVLWILVIISFLSGEYIAHNRQKGALALNTTQFFKRESAAFSVFELLASAQYDLVKAISEQENFDSTMGRNRIGKKLSNKAGVGTDNAQSYIQGMAVPWVKLRPAGVEVWVKVESESSRIQLTLSQEQNIRVILQNIYGESADDGADYRSIDRELQKDADAFADALLDWIDPDDLVRLNGAEADYYNSLSPPSEPANGPLKSMTEIFMVKDFNLELFWGSPYQYILELPIYYELKESYQLNRLNKESGSSDEEEEQLEIQTMLERFTVYSKDHVRVSMLFPEEDNRWYNEIFWLKKEGGSFKLVEQLSRVMVVEI